MTDNVGVYLAAYFDLVSSTELGEWCSKNNIPNQCCDSSFHVTIVYSRNPIDIEPCHTVDIPIYPENYHLECWDTKSGKTLVLVLSSKYLSLRFDHAMSLGASYDYDEYKPHVTLSYDIGDFDWTTLKKPQVFLNIAGEYMEPLLDA